MVKSSTFKASNTNKAVTYVLLSVASNGWARFKAVGQVQLCEVQPGQVPSPALWSKQPNAQLQAEDRVTGKWPREKDLGCWLTAS